MVESAMSRYEYCKVREDRRWGKAEMSRERYLPAAVVVTSHDVEFNTKTPIPIMKAIHKIITETAMTIRPRSIADRRFHHVEFLQQTNAFYSIIESKIKVSHFWVTFNMYQ